MQRSIKEILDERHEMLTKTADTIGGKLEKYPAGRIAIKRHGDRIYYYSYGETGEKLLKKEDRKLLEDLLQKSYLEKVVRASQSEIAALEKMRKLYPEVVAEDVYAQLSEERKKYVRPIVPTDEQFVQRWMNRPYTPKKIADDMPVYLTAKGERVRSKSEVIIADRLASKGIPYKYECPLTFRRGGEEITIHPDFTILKVSTRKTVYLEHCGKMDDTDYAEGVVARVNDFSNAGIVLGDSLFLTFETSKTPLDISVLDKMITKNFR